MDDTISSHSLARRLLEFDDLPVLIHVIKDPSTFELNDQGWDADTEYCTLDPDDIEKKPNSIVFVVEFKDWDEEMDQLNDKS